jgi:uncharacterized protein YndB with AHSA1/START domain
VTVRFDREVAATPGRVWEALTDPALLEAWLANAEFDPAVGGKVHLVWPDGEGEMRGIVTQFDPCSALEYSWNESGDSSSVLRFEIEPAPSGSTLRLLHQGTTAEDAVGFGAGWQSHLEALDSVLVGKDSSRSDRDARYEALRPLYEAILRD